MTDRVHPFEAAGLGKAPFRFLGVTENMWTDGAGLVTKPGGSCKYCWQGIRWEFWCESADGKRFPVGCDCIRKVSAKGEKLLTDAEKAFRKQQAEVRRAKKQAQMNREAARITAAKERLANDPVLLTDKPHPSIEGKTLRDYAEWMFRNAGTAGRLRVSKIVEEAA